MQKIPLATLILIILCIAFYQMEEKQNKTSLDRIYDLLQKEQYQSTFSIFTPFKYIAGLYSSTIHLNIINENNTWVQNILRNGIAIPDNNMFVTSFVLYALLEAEQTSQFKFDEQSFKDALKALEEFQDKNMEPITPIYAFWQQQFSNGTWYCSPSNLVKLVNIYLKMPTFIQSILIKLIGPIMQPSTIQGFVKAFYIPSDADDSAVNLLLGSLLKKYKPDIYKELWEPINQNYTNYIKKLKDFSYRPFLNVTGGAYNVSDKIDPRTYYYIYDFIDNSIKIAERDQVKPNLSLFTTWILNEYTFKGSLVRAPLNINNVDMTVNANCLYGLNTFLMNFDNNITDSLFDDELKQLYLNVTNFVIYGIESGIILKRPDLALTYYPSKFNFYWFVSRNYNYLKNNLQTLKYQEQKDSFESFQKVLTNKATEQILNMTIMDKNGNLYWVDFMGNTEKKKRNQDMVYSTAISINILLDIWTTFDLNTKKISYDQNTPALVRITIENAYNFSMQKIFKKDSSLMNTFFSGSIKGSCDFPFSYPGNSAYYQKNGTSVDPLTCDMRCYDGSLIYGFKGYVTSAQYEEMLNKTYFGYKVPQIFPGFNDDTFPFWSSDAITYSLALMANAKMNNLQN